MKRAAVALILLSLTCARAATNMVVAQVYGQEVLKIYAAQPINGQPANSQPANSQPAKMSDLDCAVFLTLPHDIRQCTLHTWGKQAVAEILYEVAGNPMNNQRQLWVGQMRGLPSDAQARALAKALAQEYVNWSQSPAAQQWFARETAGLGPVRFGFSVPCSVFSKLKLPAGVKSCFEGPGPADGPTIMLRLADGRSFDKGIREGVH